MLLSQGKYHAFIRQAKQTRYVAKLAYEQAAGDNSTAVGYDIRGRAIFTLKLFPADFAHLLEKVANLREEADPKKKLEELTGIKISDSIRCNLDLTNKVTDPETKKHIETLETKRPEKLARLDQNIHMSIIPLYEELLCNLDHHNAAIQKYLEEKNLLSQATKDALKEALIETQKQIQEEVNTASKKALAILNKLPKQERTVRNFNIELDKARKTAHESLKNHWNKTFTEKLSLNNKDKLNVFAALADENLKKTYKKVVAHQHDILGVDFAHNTVSYVTNSGDRGAHNKKDWGNNEKLGGWKKGESALRFMVRSKINPDMTVTYRPGGQTSARVPSLAEPKIKYQEDISRIKAIFENIQEEFKQKSGQEGAIVYNLLTSLNSGIEKVDNLRNHQNDSAKRIFHAAHCYNKETSSGNYMWVQNLGVNRHTDDLDKVFASDVHQEAKIMADISLLYTLQANINLEDREEDDILKNTYKGIVSLYERFLSNSTSPENFHKSESGKRAAELIEKCKQEIKTYLEGNLFDDIETTDKNEVVRKANLTLLKLYQENLHYKEQYGNLVQTLSIFVEKKSIAGCKSANERHEDIQKKVGTLIACEHDLESNKRLIKKLGQYLLQSVDKNKNPISLEELRQALDSHSDRTNAYGDEAAISHSDQAASSKFQTMAKAVGRFCLKTATALCRTIIGAIPGLILLGIDAVTFKAFDTNKGCSAEQVNNVNKNASHMQSGHSSKLTTKFFEMETKKLRKAIEREESLPSSVAKNNQSILVINSSMRHHLPLVVHKKKSDSICLETPTREEVDKSSYELNIKC